ncbi:hypothetical protein MCOR34_005079 [Pyricularia oryzae]|nr:hypothetical protein MCOR34_005079 [Pyricularia oryzae]KAI6517949.1 hypothetical protein MCOR16_009218 [Pyricularia oryzae]
MTRALDDQAGRRLSQEVSSATDMEETAEKTTTNLNLQKVPTTTGGEEAAVLGPEPDELPNGGLRAWLQVLGGFLLFFNSWAIVNSFGVYQSYYSQNLLSSQSPSNISWIGSIQGFLLLAVGCIAGPLFDAGYFRIVVTTGAFLVVVGFMMTSLGTEYWHMLLGQGFCMGLGAGCLVVPSLALLPQYFGPSKRALVIGIAVTGSSLGGVVYPLLFTALLSRIGFGWTNRVLGFISLGTLGTAVIVMRTRVKPRQVRSLFDPASFHETPYLLYCAALFCSNFGFFVPVFYLQQYALGHGLEHSEDLARNLVAVLNGASILGRLAPSLVVPYIGPINTMIWVAGMAAVVTFCWVAVNDLAGNETRRNMPRPPLRPRARQNEHPNPAASAPQQPSPLAAPLPTNKQHDSLMRDEDHDSSNLTETDRPSLPLYNTTFHTYRVSPLHIGNEPLTTARLSRLSHGLRDALVGDVVRGVQVRLPAEDASDDQRYGSLVLVTMMWVEVFDGNNGLLLTLQYEAAECHALLLPGEEGVDPLSMASAQLPLLLIRMPPALRLAVIEFLESEFDCRISRLALRGSNLVEAWENWADQIGLQSSSPSAMLSKDLVLTLGFRLPAATEKSVIGLKSIDVIVPASDLRQFVGEGRKQVQRTNQERPFTAALKSYLQAHIALDMDHPAVLLTKVACGGFVISEGRLKLFEPPVPDNEISEARSKETEAVDQLLQKLCAQSRANRKTLDVHS